MGNKSRRYLTFLVKNQTRLLRRWKYKCRSTTSRPEVGLILANATAALQAAAAGTSEIPILGTSITDYATALDLDNWTGTTGLNISGTSDLAPLDQQAAMLNELFPEAKNVGLLYCSAEPNSKYQATTVKKIISHVLPTPTLADV